jgi:prephenate dehydrogenase
VADRFTAEHLRETAAAYKRVGMTLNAKYLDQAADTEEMVERIASADPALVEEVLSQNEDGKWDKHLVRAFLIALAAVLKGEATNGE